MTINPMKLDGRMQDESYYQHTDATAAFASEAERAARRQDMALERIENGLGTLKGVRGRGLCCAGEKGRVVRSGTTALRLLCPARVLADLPTTALVLSEHPFPRLPDPKASDITLALFPKPKPVAELGQAMGEEIERHDVLIDEVSTKMDTVTTELKNNNARLKGLVTKARRRGRWEGRRVREGQVGGEGRGEP